MCLLYDYVTNKNEIEKKRNFINEMESEIIKGNLRVYVSIVNGYNYFDYD